jgi:nickel/cobalt exporter
MVWLPELAHGHTVLAQSYDRTITVHLQGGEKTNHVEIVVEYLLEVDFGTVFRDLSKINSNFSILDFRKDQRRYFQQFSDLYARFLGKNLSARLDSRPLEFIRFKKDTKEKDYTLEDDKGQPLGHLRCVYRFQAAATPPTAQHHTLQFREGNFYDQTGRVWLSLAAQPPVKVLHKIEPSAALQKKQDEAEIDLAEGDEEKLRRLEATFTFSDTARPEPARQPPTRVDRVQSQSPLVEYLMDPDYTLLALIALAAGFGAVHALLPGHGKTLVAAYLVGERGTAWHAVVLGLITTLTHTGMVIAVAVGLWLYFPAGHFPTESEQHDVEYALGLAGGFLVTLLGFWLLLRRLSGKSDHVHLGGHGHGHHHHSHDGHDHDHHHADHRHDAHGNVVPLAPNGQKFGWWGLVVLGVTGGLVPCWDAVFILIATVGKNALWLTLPLVLAFSAGLAATLVAIGIAVVYVKGSAASRWGDSRLIRSLPLISAALVTALGLWLCYDTVRTHAARSQTKLAGEQVRQSV